MPACLLRNVLRKILISPCISSDVITIQIQRCNGNCIRATQPWIMFVEGHTVELSFITASQQICEGANSQLVATAQYGVAPYNYLWTPGWNPR